MEELTLDQVRKAGRFAWCALTDCFFAEGRFWTAYEAGDEYDGGLGVFEDVGEAKAEHVAALRTNWHHLPGCDCEFCRA